MCIKAGTCESSRLNPDFLSYSREHVSFLLSETFNQFEPHTQTAAGFPTVSPMIINEHFTNY